MSRKNQLPPNARNVANPKAAALADAINKGGDAEKLIRDAIIDAQIHADWRGVAAIENSLTNVDYRTLGRKLLALGARGIVIQRSDGTELAQRIPDGFDFGIAWLVTSVFLCVEGDFDSLMEISIRSWEGLANQADSKITWGQFPMWAAAPSFGPPTRSLLTRSAFDGSMQFHYTHMESTRSLLESQRQASGGLDGPQSGLLWGCYVTGSNDLSELFNPEVWAPGLDLAEASQDVVSQIAAASESDEDVHIHPQVMAADKAMDFASWMMREQSIQEFREYVFAGSFENAKATVALLEPSSAPYMDMINLGLWSKHGRLRQTLTFPRSGNDLMVDAEHMVEILHANGLVNTTVVSPKLKRPADDAYGHVVDANGNWEKSEVAGLGPAIAYVKTPEWLHLESLPGMKPGMERLPPVVLLSQLGAISALSDHYQPGVATSIKEALSKPGNPDVLIMEVLHGSPARDNELVDGLLSEDWSLLVPKREVALSAQFKLAGGALANVSRGLITLLEATDIGGDCPVEMMRPSYDIMYLRVQKTVSFDESEEPCVIDGILVQRWDDGTQTSLLLDSFIASATDDPEDAYPLYVETLEFEYPSEATLDDLHKQVESGDDFGKVVLGLVAGILLYMNSKDARLLTSNDRTNLADEMAGKNRKKRKPGDYQQLNGSYDHILVGPTEGPAHHDGVDESGRKVKAHYRRGFIRTNQRYGPGRSMTRPVFIPPVLVNSKSIVSGQELPEKKIYTVK